MSGRSSVEYDEDSSEAEHSEERSSSGKPHHTGTNVSSQKQKVGQSHGQKPVLRRKVAAATKPKVPTRIEPAALKQQQPQTVVNRARGTLHGLSTIKRHGNVRVAPNTDYLAV